MTSNDDNPEIGVRVAYVRLWMDVGNSPVGKNPDGETGRKYRLDDGDGGTVGAASLLDTD